MPRRWRFDGSGVWHHVMNRGLARRTVFEDVACVRYFLSCLARVVRRGLIEVHSYSVMTTHFHLLVRSPTAELARGLQLVQNRYVRWFNRRSRRDGPLFRGRFLSRAIASLEYRRAVVAYIDANPVEARMTPSPELYPHGSARHYARSRGPIWLERSWVESDATARAGTNHFDLSTYLEAFGTAFSGAARGLVEARLHSRARGADPLDDLVAAAPEAVGRWMRQKAQLADGTQPGIPCASADTVLRVWERHASLVPNWQLARGPSLVGAWPTLAVGLLRDLAGLSWAEIQRRTGASDAAIQRRYQTHRVWMELESAYSSQAAALGKECLRA